MSWHWNVEHNTARLYFWIYLSQSLCCNFCLEVVLCTAVLEGEKALPHRVAVADFTVVDECDFSVSPTEQVPCNLAAERA